jgi:hypothetical protein
MLWRKVIVSKSYHSGQKGAIIATYSYRFDNILAIIAFRFITLTARQQRQLTF